MNQGGLLLIVLSVILVVWFCMSQKSGSCGPGEKLVCTDTGCYCEPETEGFSKRDCYHPRCKNWNIKCKPGYKLRASRGREGMPRARCRQAECGGGDGINYSCKCCKSDLEDDGAEDVSRKHCYRPRCHGWGKVSCKPGYRLHKSCRTYDCWPGQRDPCSKCCKSD